MYSLLIVIIIQQFIALINDDTISLITNDLIKIFNLTEEKASLVNHIGEFFAKSNLIMLITLIIILSMLFFLDYIDKTVNIDSLAFKSLKKASPLIKKLLDENKRVYKTHGPNSSSQSVDDIRNSGQIPIWEIIKKTKIIPNNEKIYSILEKIKKYDTLEIPTVQLMKNHIESFKEHVMGDSIIDYTNNQFPIKFSILISKYANNNRLLKSKFYKKYLDWINLYISCNQNNIECKNLFGSTLYCKEPSDIDILILIDSDNSEAIKNNAILLRNLGKDFYKEFDKKLHITTFNKKQINEYKDFKKKLLDTKEF